MATKGKEAFLEFLHRWYKDPQEFQSLLNALKSSAFPALAFQPDIQTSLQSLWHQHHLPFNTVSWYPHALMWPDAVPKGKPLPGFSEGWLYPLNLSSLIPVTALNLKPQDIVLDACAAPGGKSFCIVSNLKHASQLVSNDLSPHRVARLRRMFESSALTSIRITNRPAEILWRSFPNTFDKILLDAPCSSEQHTLNSEKHLKIWGLNRPKQLQKRQFVMIKSLSRCLKPGGLLVYSTCAINPLENEYVVDQVITKLSDKFTLVPPPRLAYPAGPGFALPSLHYNPSAVLRSQPHLHQVDPMFVAVFQKT